MPRGNDRVMQEAERLYWAIQNTIEPEIAQCFHLHICRSAVYVYCEGHAPSAVAKMVDPPFFARHGIGISHWEKVFCFPWPNEKWVDYDSGKHANFPGGRLGWRHREPIHMEMPPPTMITAIPSGPANLVKIPRSDDDETENAPSSSPGVIRKIMD